MYPSATTLSTIFGDKGAEARAILDGKKNPEEYPTVARWIRECYSLPTRAELKMEALAELGEFCGVEAAFSRRSDTVPEFTYLNAGDMYALTLIRYRSGSYRVACCGDVIESMERRGIKFD